MRAMVLDRPGQPLAEREVAEPVAGEGEVVIAVEACGVCRTDLHVRDGELPDPALPLILGHQAVGRITSVGDGVEELSAGDRVGAPWLAWTDGTCERCREGRENLCPNALFHGYTRDGGYAEAMRVDARYAFPLDPDAEAAALAPLLCAGLIGYRALRMCGDAERVGLYGFGSSAHLICRLLVAQGRRPYAFTREGDRAGQEFARSVGAVWAGDSSARPPEELDAAIVFAPVGDLVPAALRVLRPAGVVVCAGIHMSDIPSFPYDLLWHERQVRSVANLTRQDGIEFLPLASEAGVRPEVTTYPLAAAERALDDLRSGRVEGSAVLEVG
jgi:propanol-preferring alcohol dehydrogenase